MECRSQNTILRERYLNPILYLVRSTGFCMVVMRAA